MTVEDLPNSGVWQIRHLIGESQRRRIRVIWKLNLLEESDAGQILIEDVGEYEELPLEERKKLFGVLNSDTKARFLYYDTSPTW